MHKLNYILSITTAVTFSLSALAGKTDGQYETKIEKAEIVLTVKKGFHFNDKAPASILFDEGPDKVQPTLKTELKFVFSKNEKAKKAKLSFYVCDDAKTVCEQHAEEIKLNEKKPANVSAESKALDTAENKYSKTTLLEFSAPWCPACIRLKSETMNKAEVKMLFKKIDVKEINIDLVENEMIATKYGVKNIPTLVLVNENGEELNRWLDYQPAQKFVSEFKQALKTTVAVSDLEKKAQAGDVKAATTVGLNYYSKTKWQEATKWLSMSKDQDIINKKLAAEISWAEENVNNDKDETIKAYSAALEKGFTLTSSKVDQIRWKIDYLDLQVQHKKTIDAKTIENVEKELTALLADKNIKTLYAQSTEGDLQNFEKAETLYMLSKVYKIASDKNKETLFKNKIVENVDKIKLDINKPGQLISAIDYYNAAEAFDKVEAVHKKLVAKYEKTYVYHQKYAGFLFKRNRYDEALKQIDLALQYKEGNEPQLSVTKVKILKELKKKDEAMALIEATLKLTNAFPDKYKRTQSALEDLKKTLTK